MKSEARKQKLHYEKALTQDRKDLIEGTVGAFLEKTYPGYMWWVHVEQRLLIVKCIFASKEMGFVCRADKLSENMHEIMLAGGEILERYRLSRNRVDTEMINNAPRNIKGDMLHD